MVSQHKESLSEAKSQFTFIPQFFIQTPWSWLPKANLGRNALSDPGLCRSSESVPARWHLLFCIPGQIQASLD